MSGSTNIIAIDLGELIGTVRETLRHELGQLHSIVPTMDDKLAMIMLARERHSDGLEWIPIGDHDESRALEQLSNAIAKAIKALEVQA